MSEKPYRVIQWATGKNGRALLRGVIDHPALELVGCKVFTADKHGVDAGVIAGREPIGVKATMDLDEILALDADVVLHIPILLPDRSEMDANLLALLRSGKNVIELTGASSYLPALGEDVAKPFADACREGNATLYGTGINPGYIMERLVPTLTGLCTHLESADATEEWDCADGTAQILFETMGFGVTPGERSSESPTTQMFLRMFTQSLHVAASSLGIEVDHVAPKTEYELAGEDIQLDAGLVRKGTICRIRNRWEAIPRDAAEARLAINTVWTVDHATKDETDWDENSGWRIEIKGTPAMVANLHLADPEDPLERDAFMVGAALPAIAEVCEAEPGFLKPRIFAPFRRHLG